METEQENFETFCAVIKNLPERTMKQLCEIAVKNNSKNIDYVADYNNIEICLIATGFEKQPCGLWRKGNMACRVRQGQVEKA